MSKQTGGMIAKIGRLSPVLAMLTKRQLKACDRFSGALLLIPWPLGLTRPERAGAEQEATAAEQQAALTLIGDDLRQYDNRGDRGFCHVADETAIGISAAATLPRRLCRAQALAAAAGKAGEPAVHLVRGAAT